MTTAKTPKLPETEFQLPEPEKTQDEKMTASATCLSPAAPTTWPSTSANSKPPSSAPTSTSRRSLRTNSRA